MTAIKRKYTHFVVDVESDGPFVPENSMISLGIIKVEPTLYHSRYEKIRPISTKWDPAALAGQWSHSGRNVGISAAGDYYSIFGILDQQCH